MANAPSSTSLASNFHRSRQPPASYLETAICRSNSRSSLSTLFHKPNLLGPESYRWRASHHRPLYSKPVHRWRNIQNARYQQNQSFHPERRILHLARSFRGILPHSHPPSLSKVPSFHLQQSPLFLSSDAFRYQTRTPHFHESGDGNSEVSSQPTHTGVSVFGRLAPMEYVTQPTSSEHDTNNFPLESVGFYDQLGKITTSTSTYCDLPRSHLARPIIHDSAEPTEHREILHRSTSPPFQTNFIKEGISTVPGDNKFHRAIHSSGKISPPPGGTISTQIQKQIISLSPSCSSRPDSLVGGQKQSVATNSYIHTSPTGYGVDRRVKFWMGGSLLGRQHRLGDLDSNREVITYQCSRGESSFSLSPSSVSLRREFNSCQDGQLSCGVSDKQTRLEQECRPEHNTPLSSPTLSPTHLGYHSQTHPRTSEYLGRLTLSKPHNKIRMDPNPEIFSDASHLHASRSGPICTPRECPTSPIRLRVFSSTRHSDRCTDSELEPLDLPIPFPSSRLDSSMSNKAPQVQRKRHLRRTSSSFRSMVARVYDPMRAIKHRARNFPTRPKPTKMGTLRDVLAFSRIRFLTSIFTRKFHPAIAEALTTSLRTSTNSQYEYCWKQFQKWLSSQDSLAVTKRSVLLYLLDLSKTRKLNPKTILVHRNALQLPLLHGFGISTKDQEFSMLARSQFLENPPQQRFIPNWNPNTVLAMLEQPRFETDTCATDDLLAKTLFLVALATGNRVSELAAMSRTAISFSQDVSEIVIPMRPGFLYKNQSQYRTPPNIVIRALWNEDDTNHLLCPVKALRRWLQISSNWGTEAVFINPNSKKAMNRGSISLHLVKTINAAIPGAFAKAHDVRKISASLAWARGVSPHEITQFMFWTSSNTFIKKYLVPLKEARQTHCIAANSSS